VSLSDQEEKLFGTDEEGQQAQQGGGTATAATATAATTQAPAPAPAPAQAQAQPAVSPPVSPALASIMHQADRSGRQQVAQVRLECKLPVSCLAEPLLCTCPRRAAPAAGPDAGSGAAAGAAAAAVGLGPWRQPLHLESLCGLLPAGYRGGHLASSSTTTGGSAMPHTGSSHAPPMQGGGTVAGPTTQTADAPTSTTPTAQPTASAKPAKVSRPHPGKAQGVDRW
jgi:hypothetical protein